MEYHKFEANIDETITISRKEQQQNKTKSQETITPTGEKEKYLVCIISIPMDVHNTSPFPFFLVISAEIHVRADYKVQYLIKEHEWPTHIRVLTDNYNKDTENTTPRHSHVPIPMSNTFR